jgi:hypothetical protein
MLAGLQRLGDLGQSLGNLARDFGRLFGWVELVWLVPDEAQAFDHLGLVQIFEVDAVAVAVGKVGVVLALTREVGKHLDTVTDVADEQERRPAIRRGKCFGIFLGLPPGVEHQHVPGARRSALAARLTLGDEQVSLAGDGLLLPLLSALLGFEDEAPLAVEIDTPG